MITEPRIVEKAAQRYLAIKTLVTMESIGAHVDRQFPEILAWLAERRVRPSGAPFIKYNAFGADGSLEIETGVPVGSPTAGNGRVVAGSLPAGRYATLTHFGGFDGLMAANAALQDWVSAQDLAFDVEGDQESWGRWAARLEIYHADPSSEPDEAKWETEVSYKLSR